MNKPTAKLRITHMLDGVTFDIDVPMVFDDNVTASGGAWIAANIDSALEEAWLFARFDGSFGNNVYLECNVMLNEYFGTDGGTEYNDSDEEWEEYNDEANYFVIECIITEV